MLKPELTWQDKFHQLASLYLSESALAGYLLHQLKVSRGEAVCALNKLSSAEVNGLETFSKEVVSKVINGTFNGFEIQPLKKWPEIRIKLKQGEKYG